jgi:diguanylate cyclase (GGDEF)-like protein
VGGRRSLAAECWPRADLPITMVVESVSGDVRRTTRLMVHTACAMFAAAAVDGVVESFLPGDPPSSLLPVGAAIVLPLVLLATGTRVPRWALALLGPLGVALIAVAMATTPNAGDGAVLYAMPVLWTSAFFGRRGAVAIVACVAVGHAIALLLLPGDTAYPGRWVNVMVAVCATAIVVRALDHRNVVLGERLAHEARTDALTGLLNRRGFDERAQLEMARMKREPASVAVLAFDIDHFKDINDAWGHECGDRVLARLGVTLAGLSREIDVVGRMGGEEFVVLMPDSDAADAAALDARLRWALAAEADPGCGGPGSGREGLPAIRVSAGIAVGQPGDALHGLLRDADDALYGAKRAGRNRTVVFAGRPAPAAAAPAGPVA